ncbi:unnamed protein product, partial [Adineta steineri]
LSISKVLLSS